MGEADPGAEQHREPLDQGSLDAVGASSVLAGRGGQEHGDEVDIGAPRDGVASHDAAVEVGAVQAWSERLGQQARRRLGHALILGLHVGQVGLRANVTLGVKTVHLMIVADQGPVKEPEWAYGGLLLPPPQPPRPRTWDFILIRVLHPSLIS